MDSSKKESALREGAKPPFLMLPPLKLDLIPLCEIILDRKSVV